jgi:hypothetical protein
MSSEKRKRGRPKKDPNQRLVKKKISEESSGPLVEVEIERKTVALQKNLSFAQLDIVDALLMKGDTPYNIAKRIQKDWGLLNHITTQSVQSQIEAYRRNFFGTEVVTTVTTTDNETQETTVETKTVNIVSTYLKGRLDAYTLNEQMVLLQIKRINKIMDREEKMPTLLDQTRKEIELLTKMMQNFTNLQFELGIVQRMAQVLDHQITLNNPDLLVEEKRVADKIKAIQGRDMIISRVKNVLNMVSHLEMENAEALEAEVVELERAE